MTVPAVSRPRLAFASRLVAILVTFRIIDVLIQRLGERPIIAYGEVGRWWQLASSRIPWWLAAYVVGVVGVAFLVDRRWLGGDGWRRVRGLTAGWDALDEGRSLRWLVVGITGVAAWALSCYSRNLYLDTWNLADRLLIVALWLAIAWRPIFVLPFALAGVATGAQFLIPLGFISRTEMGVILRFPILFGAFWIVVVMTRWRDSDLFVFAWVCLLAATYWTSGLGKLRVGWLTHPHVHFLLLGAYANGWLAGVDVRVIERAARWVASMAYPLMLFTLIVECGSLVMLWRRWSLIGFFVLATAFHLGAFAMTGIFFWKWMLVDAMLLVYLLRGQRLARLAIFTPSLFGLSVVAILASPLWVPSENLTWFDTPLTYVLDFVGVDAKGASHQLPAGFFRPYGDAIVLGPAGATPPHPKLTRGMGVTMDRSVAAALEAAGASDSVLAIEKARGIERGDSAASAVLDKFVATYAANARCAKERDPALLRAFGVPRHLWTFPLDASIPCGVPIERVRLVERTVYFDGDHLRTIRQIVLREVALSFRAKPRSGGVEESQVSR
jgi:hypothetical protein